MYRTQLNLKHLQNIDMQNSLYFIKPDPTDNPSKQTHLFKTLLNIPVRTNNPASNILPNLDKNKKITVKVRLPCVCTAHGSS